MHLLCWYIISGENPSWNGLGQIFRLWDKNIDVTNEEILYQQIRALMINKEKKIWATHSHQPRDYH